MKKEVHPNETENADFAGSVRCGSRCGDGRHDPDLLCGDAGRTGISVQLGQRLCQQLEQYEQFQHGQQLVCGVFVEHGGEFGTGQQLAACGIK